MFKTINAVTAYEWLKNNEAVIIDVREPAEYDSIHIEGAKLIPLGTLDNGKLPDLQGKKLIVHCMLGKRGGKACETLLLGNPDLDVYNLEGGITAWENAGLKVVKG
ncbi:MAG TPA: rhodanese-like domain-containing protein [Gammaproteobacteria bacterium]|jgi:rhodanese-related sulfurtransferase|nr:rhodanese-like domain-containing protein [Gammaproteobacteria bacterium]